MSDPRFYDRKGAFALGDLARLVEADIGGADASLSIADIADLATAQSGEIGFFNNNRYKDALAETSASAVLVAADKAEAVPEGVVPVVAADPHAAMTRIAWEFYPDMPPMPGDLQDGHAVHPTAEIEEGVSIATGALIGPKAVIGRGTRIGAYALIGHGVSIGRDCIIGPGTAIGYAMLGDRVIIHPKVVIGGDGFGVVPGENMKVPHVGRVVIQSDVEIGVATLIDRGALGDTSVGAFTKIDNDVHVGHNVSIGHHCLIAGKTGLGGSSRIGNHVMLGARSGVAPHVSVGDGAQVGGMSGVLGAVAEGDIVMGHLARPMLQFLHEQAFVARLAKKEKDRRK